MNILPHNNKNIAALSRYQAIGVVDDMINGMEAEIHAAEWLVAFDEDPHIQVKEMRDLIRLHKFYSGYLWAEHSLECTLEDIGDIESKIDYFEEKACSPVVKSDIEDNLQAAEEMSLKLDKMIDSLTMREFHILKTKKEYLYACIEEINSVIGNLSIWGFCTLDAKNEKQALLKGIELLEEKIQRSLV